MSEEGWEQRGDEEAVSAAGWMESSSRLEKKKHPDWEGRSQTISSLFVDDMIPCIENPKEPTTKY